MPCRASRFLKTWIVYFVLFCTVKNILYSMGALVAWKQRQAPRKSGRIWSQNDIVDRHVRTISCSGAPTVFSCRHISGKKQLKNPTKWLALFSEFDPFGTIHTLWNIFYFIMFFTHHNVDDQVNLKHRECALKLNSIAGRKSIFSKLTFLTSNPNASQYICLEKHGGPLQANVSLASVRLYGSIGL